jgi:TonB family protein
LRERSSSTWQIDLPSELRREPGARVEDRYEGRIVCVPKAALSPSITRRPVVDPGALTVKDLEGSPPPLPADVLRSCDPEVEPPRPIRMVHPAYTAEAMHAKIEGNDVLLGVVGPTGEVSVVRVLESLEPGLDAEAEKAFKQWRFQPAKRHGEPVAMAVTIEMSFRLR